ncbi:MAG: 2-oxoacid:acceptor oxidoreductase subunit alpha [Planctomycetota bacterium]|nr:2-oxoacid:acceptor oxidoreductase subunit alpha [Planctomycetota bacterium]
MSTTTTPEKVKGATIRFAGDSGDGMQLSGTQLTNTSALAGNDVATFPDYPAEIRAPRGTRAGVSGFQVQIAAEDIFTPGDQLDTLVVMNPAALVTNIGDLKTGGTLIVNEDSFQDKDLRLAKLDENPLDGEGMDEYRVIKIKMTLLTRTAVEELGLSTKIADRCKNFFAMGFVYWLYNRDLQPTLDFIQAKFGGMPNIAEANEKSLKAGFNYGETTEAAISTYQVDQAKLPKGRYRNIMGNQALAIGCVTAAKLSDRDLFLGSYPITPASDILHELSKHKKYGVRTFQAEDEIAAVCSAIGAAFAGHMAITASSGPGIALKGEAMGLGMILELPMIIINVQRGGPSTGLPTKTEQSDLYQAMYGRNGESPLPIVAPQSPSDCFTTAIDAWRIAVTFMCPVIILSDGYIANGAEPWKIPTFDSLEKIDITHPAPRDDDEPAFLPYARDENLSRPWALPGTKGLEHRIGGLEKAANTGDVSYDPDNHQAMCELRQEKVDRIAGFIPPQEVFGPEKGDLLVLSWGGTYGACRTAVTRAQAAGTSVAHAQLRYLNPFPSNLEEVLKNYDKVLIPELNLGQLKALIQSKYLVECVGLNKVQGRPFAIVEIEQRIAELTS